MNILARSRSASQLALDRARRPSLSNPNPSFDPDHSSDFDRRSSVDDPLDSTELSAGQDGEDEKKGIFEDEQTPLLDGSTPVQFSGSIKSANTWRSLPSRMTTGVYGAVKIMVTWITAPGHYLIACFFDENGNFSPLLPIISIARSIKPKKRKKVVATAYGGETFDEKEHSKTSRRLRRTSGAFSANSEGEAETENLMHDSPSRHTRSKSNFTGENEGVPSSQRSIRYKLADSKRRRRDDGQPGSGDAASKESATELVAASLKSPSSPASLKIHKFPRTPLPPRPLVPRRQPSYSKLPIMTAGAHAKTLILDLDETLIHSHSKGGRFTTGHMVEVKMSHPVGYGGITIGPQVPILYYVHKRPYCDEFLRKVSRWYNLVVFTASVQEYADPVIDWLELERKYFAARYYRQHCTMRTGAYVKDLSQVEPDLSKVMIVDNSPLSYAFHEDNAVPIEGWISDPTDNDLLHLIPMLEALQYSTDVRAVLALRRGQDKLEVV